MQVLWVRCIFCWCVSFSVVLCVAVAETCTVRIIGSDECFWSVNSNTSKKLRRGYEKCECSFKMHSATGCCSVILWALLVSLPQDFVVSYETNAMFRDDFEKTTSCSLEVIWHLRAFEYQRTESPSSCLLCILLIPFIVHLFTLFQSPTVLLRYELNNAGESRHPYLSILNFFISYKI
jgi:hypothetical protein